MVSGSNNKVRAWLTAGAVGLAALGGKVLLKGGAVVGGAVAGRAAMSYFNSSDVSRAQKRGFESISPDAAAVLRPVEDSSYAFFKVLGAKAAAYGLDPSEEEEVLRFRQQLANVMDVTSCSIIYSNPAPDSALVARVFAMMPDSSRERLSYLMGRGMARLLLNRAPSASALTDTEIPEFYARYASPAELDLIAGMEGASTHEATCAGARTMLLVPLRADAGDPNRSRAIRWVLRLGVTPYDGPTAAQ